MLALLCSACAARPAAFAPVREFSLGFTLQKGAFCCGGTVTARGADDLRVEFGYPEGLSYFNVAVTPEGLRAGVAETEDAALLEALPEDAPLKLLIAALKTFVYYPQAFAPDREGRLTAEAVLAEKRVCAVFAQNGLPMEFRCEETGLTVTFTEETDPGG